MDDRIKQDLKEAQLARDKVRVSTLRLLISEIYNAKLQKGGELNDEEISAVIRREIKKRKEAQVGFKAGGREDSAQREEMEASLLEQYLPEQMSDEELTKIVDMTITELGAKNISEMGKVMSLVRERVDNRADGARVSSLVKIKLHG